MDIVLLSRLQFALTIMFHYLFPPLTIGMSVVLVYLEYRAFRTDDPIYRRAAHFWTAIFGLNFAIGVATGIVMEFQFGLNWAAYSRFVGDVFGSALAAEGIFAFFLESGFLAVLLFGWDRVSKGMHLFATCMVSLGSIFSAIWIVVANSWQQTPAGHRIVNMFKDGAPWLIDGVVARRAEIENFWQMLFNPSSVIRLVHVLIGCFVMGALFILSISAWYLLRRRHLEFAKRSFQGALILLTVSAFSALFTGHIQAKVVYRYQPAKLATAEAHFRTGPGALVLFGIPNAQEQRVDYAVKLPGALSFLLFEDFSTPVVGLDKFQNEDRPNLIIPFVSWRMMVGLGLFFIVLGLLGCFLLWRGKLYETRALLWVFVFAVAGGVIANQAGWVMAEVGRQPWSVHPPVNWVDETTIATSHDGKVRYDESQGLRTSVAISKSVPAKSIVVSIAGFSVIYLLLLALWIFALDKKIRHGPDDVEDVDKESEFQREAQIASIIAKSDKP